MTRRRGVRLGTNARAVREDVKRRKNLLAALIKQRAQQLEQQGLGMAVLGLNVTVYGTEAGAYARSEDLLRGVHVTAKRARRGLVQFRVWNTAPYAPLVEYGTYGDRISPAEAERRASASGAQPTPLVTGRSGVNYAQPSLAHTRALVWMLERLRLDVKGAWFRAWL